MRGHPIFTIQRHAYRLCRSSPGNHHQSPVYVLKVHDNKKRHNSLFYRKIYFPIVHFALMCSNLYSSTMHMEYIYLSVDTIFRACVSYHVSLIEGFLVVKFKSSLRRFYGHHQNMVNRYRISVSQMTNDMFCLS